MNAVEKQQVLKPQDLVVAMKIYVNPAREFIIATLADELEMAGSAVHGSIKRAEQARLLSRSAGSIRARKAQLKEFLLYGAKYAYPVQLGVVGRGVATAVGSPVLGKFFETSSGLAPVWSDPLGDAWGPTLTPLHSSVPAASKKDPALYDMLALFDALRAGAAREREIAIQLVEELFV